MDVIPSALDDAAGPPGGAMAAIDGNVDAIEEAGGIGREEFDDAGDLEQRALAAERNLPCFIAARDAGGGAVVAWQGRSFGARHWGVDHARRKRERAHFLGPPIDGESFGEAVHAELGV